jgi:hypothetical protein
MKTYIFYYRCRDYERAPEYYEACFCCSRDQGHEYSSSEEVSFPNSVTDWEVIEEAQKRQLLDKVSGKKNWDYAIHRKILIRILHVAREISFDPDPEVSALPDWNTRLSELL